MHEKIRYHKYARNRRTYDENRSRYAKLEDIDHEIRQGNQITVHLLEGKETLNPVDITCRVLLQVLLAREIAQPFLKRADLLALIERSNNSPTRRIQNATTETAA